MLSQSPTSIAPAKGAAILPGDKREGFMKTAFAAATLAFAAFGTTEAAGPSLIGEWRVTRAVTAPYAETEFPALSGVIGKTVTVSARKVRGPSPLSCGRARIAETEVPPPGLFQGGLGADYSAALLSLALPDQPLSGASLTCDAGIFEFHFVNDETAIIGLDNRIWTLDRTVGARAVATSPEGVVQRFLEMHFQSDMGFWPSAINKKRKWFSAPLLAAMDAYFARIAGLGEEPPINGDPFTNSQDYPARFAVGAENKATPAADVPVQFAQAGGDMPVTFLMRKEADKWRIDDVRFEDGESLTGLLAMEM